MKKILLISTVAFAFALSSAPQTFAVETPAPAKPAGEKPAKPAGAQPANPAGAQPAKPAQPAQP